MPESPLTRQELSAWRKAMRTSLIDARLKLTTTFHRAATEAITERLLRHFVPLPAPVLGFYWPFRREFNPLPFVNRLIAKGDSAALPVVVDKAGPLEFRRWEPGDAMEVGVYDIPYPAARNVVTPEALLIPVVGFDSGGYRLGYGGGYYDRTLATYAVKPLTIGVGFDFCRMETIQPQPYDIPLDYIVTESAIFQRGENGLRSIA